MTLKFPWKVDLVIHANKNKAGMELRFPWDEHHPGSQKPPAPRSLTEGLDFPRAWILRHEQTCRWRRFDVDVCYVFDMAPSLDASDHQDGIITCLVIRGFLLTFTFHC